MKNSKETRWLGYVGEFRDINILNCHELNVTCWSFVIDLNVILFLLYSANIVFQNKSWHSLQKKQKQKKKKDVRLMACLLTRNQSKHESEWVGFGVSWIWNQDSESEYAVYFGFRNRSRNHYQSHSCVYLEQESKLIAVNLFVYPFIYYVFKNLIKDYYYLFIIILLIKSKVKVMILRQ